VAALTLDGVTKVYASGVRAVDSVRLRAGDGEFLVLLGPSGCGKTTILRMIAGLEEITSGDLWLDDQHANDLPPPERNVAMVFQDGALYPHLTVRDNLAFPLLSARPADRQAVKARVAEIAQGLGIQDTLDRRPAQLSGGERQRVAIGRALIRGQPAVLLMDEPLASLDVGLRSGLRAEIRSLARSLNVTTVYVTHDQVEALSLADRVVVLRGGTVEDVGSPAQVYEDPATAFVAAFLGSPPVNLAWATVWVVNGDRVIVDFGSQRLELPWDDAFSEALTPSHGQPVIVGIRPEFLTRSTAGDHGSLLCGKVSSVEYHGHEWLARLEVGFRPVDLDAVLPAGPPSPGAAAIRRRLPFPGGRGLAPPAGERHGAHRAANLLVKLDSASGWTVGHEVRMTVDVAHIYVFGADGKRIGPAQSSRSSR
jgi:multiple sugar transport system ATP-binding protein